MKPRGLVAHTVGVKGDTSAASIRKFHMAPKPAGNGWRDIGYHFVIRKDGRVEQGRPLDQTGAHLEGANDTWGVCISGDGDSEPWTPAQLEAFLDLAEVLCKQQGWSADRVVGHREGPAKFGARPTSKRCPGRLINMATVRELVAARLVKP
jgi:N-acetyl-anhydromuramyl-L-alanine amidase AmpD